MRLAPTLFVFASAIAAAQPRDEVRALREEVRALIDKFVQAIRDGDREMGTKYFTSDFQFYSPGGTTVPPGRDATGRRWLPWKRRAIFIRHIQMLSPDAALVIGIWKDPEAA